MCRGVGIATSIRIYQRRTASHMLLIYTNIHFCMCVCALLVVFVVVDVRENGEKGASEKNELNLHRKLVKKLRQSCATTNTDTTLGPRALTSTHTHTNWRISYMLFILTYEYTNKYTHTYRFHNYKQQ